LRSRPDKKTCSSLLNRRRLSRAEVHRRAAAEFVFPQRLKSTPTLQRAPMSCAWF
jgi:hypothetical protein